MQTNNSLYMALRDKLQKIQPNDKSQIDWGKRRTDWISSVDELNNKIKEWFDDYANDNLLKFEITTKNIIEEFIGSYEVNELHLIFADNKEVVIEPMGTLIIGAWARFDIFVRGYNSEKYYILCYKDDSDKYTWKIVNAQNKIDAAPLTKRKLEQIFEKWLS
ncbi:MAG: hypothetical protein U5N85_10560 [Arcicella sp.]|nr:hypothetical protein [Arcicella sp.]